MNDNYQSKLTNLETEYNNVVSQRNSLNEQLLRIEGAHQVLEDLVKEQTPAPSSSVAEATVPVTVTPVEDDDKEDTDAAEPAPAD